MTNFPDSFARPQCWSPEALALAAQAKVLSGNKLVQLVVRLQRHTGRTREACWRFIIQYGIKGKVDRRRWTEEEIEVVREELVKRSVEEIARKLNRTAKSVRSMLQRNGFCVREIRCDLFSIESLARALRVRKAEIHFWIKQGWLQASVNTQGKRYAANHERGMPNEEEEDDDDGEESYRVTLDEGVGFQRTSRAHTG